MKKLTRERAHDLCVEMWNDIAENGYTDKGESYLSEHTAQNTECFACDYYSTESEDGVITCMAKSRCPLNIIIGRGYGCEIAGPYLVWCDEGQEREHAIAIADLFIE